MSDRQIEIFQNKDARSGKTLNELKDEYFALRAEKRAAKLAERERNVKFAAIDLCILDQLKKVEEVAGTDMWRAEDGATFSPKHRALAKVTDPVAFLMWIHEHEREDELRLPQGKLNELIKEALDTDAAALLTPTQRAELRPGEPASCAPPPGVSVTIQTRVHHTGGVGSEDEDDEDGDDE